MNTLLSAGFSVSTLITKKLLQKVTATAWFYESRELCETCLPQPLCSIRLAENVPGLPSTIVNQGLKTSEQT